MINFRREMSSASVSRRGKSSVRVFNLLAALTCISLFINSPVAAQQTETGRATVTVNSPEIIKAGESVHFTITIDRAPNFKGASLQYQISSPSGALWAAAVALDTNKVSYEVVFEVPAAAEGGNWSLSRLVFYPAFGAEAPLKNFKPVPFRVIASSNLIFPTSAEVNISPSQIQLLRREALNVQSRVQVMKADLVRIQPSPKKELIVAILQRNLKEASDAVQRTEKSFNELGTSQPGLPAAKIFFADLQAAYLGFQRTDFATQNFGSMSDEKCSDQEDSVMKRFVSCGRRCHSHLLAWHCS